MRVKAYPEFLKLIQPFNALDFLDHIVSDIEDPEFFAFGETLDLGKTVMGEVDFLEVRKKSKRLEGKSGESIGLN